MRLLLSLVIVSILVVGCAPSKEYFRLISLKPNMVNQFKSSAEVTLVNGQPNKVHVPVVGAEKMLIDLNYTTENTIGLLAHELKRKGVTIVDDADKKITVTLEKIVLREVPPHIPDCFMTYNIKAGDDISKKIIEHNVSLDWNAACSFTPAKAVAAILNDDEIRAYIDDKPYVPVSKRKNITTGGASAKERLQKLKELLDQGLISRGDYNKKKDAILNEL